MNILVYYNINHNNFYNVYTSYIPIDRKVGYTNGYGHILVQILMVVKNHYVSIISYFDFMKLSYNESLKSRLAKRMIRWLNKYRE